MQKNVQQRITTEALTGRLPIMPSERVYPRYITFVWTCCAFSAATWAYLIGSYLPYVGNTMVGVIAYFCGVTFGMVPVTLASGIPSVRYGVDAIDAAKSSFGTKGIIVPLIGMMATLIGWTGVLVAMTAQGGGNMWMHLGNTKSAPGWFVVLIGILSIIGVWLITSRGPWLFERLSNYIAPGHIVVALVMIGVLVAEFGVVGTLTQNISADQAYTPDQYTNFLFGFEFGMANAFTWWPVMGGLTRLVQRQKHVIGPSVVGVGILGAAFLSAISAFAAVTAGTYDPTEWMMALGGDILGTAMVAFILLANLATMVIMIYLAGVGAQQIRKMAKIPWVFVVGVLLVPCVLAAVRSEWVLSHVVNWLTFNGLMFAGITGITLTDYFVLRRQKIHAKSLFVRNNKGDYYFWGGVNWIAVILAIASVAFFMYLYNPVTLSTAPAFSFIGVSIPTIFLTGLVYYALMKIIAIPMGVGNYNRYSESSVASSEAAEDVSDADVSL